MKYYVGVLQIHASDIVKVFFFCAITILLWKLCQENGAKISKHAPKVGKNVPKSLENEYNHEFSSLHIQVSKLCAKSAKFCAVTGR